jgi:predicted kinase
VGLYYRTTINILQPAYKWYLIGGSRLIIKEKINMRKVIVMSGVSGSGKTTYAEKLLNETGGSKVSADHYFMQFGEYVFKPAKLGEAHADCFRQFLFYLKAESCPLIVVDNTNLDATEIAPYMLGASAFGWSAEIITLWHRVPALAYKMLAERNVHGVSQETIIQQMIRLYDRKLPSYWKNTAIDVKVQ